MSKIRFNLNGKPVEASYEPGMHFLEVLREELGVVSAKNGCAPEGSCGCCLVMIDGHPALPCLRKPEQMEGRDVVTVEGLSEELRGSIGDAFVLEGGVQCGFCIPGIVIRAASLIEQRRTADRGARILKIHTDDAAAVPGVVRVFTSADVPGSRATGLNDPDQPLFVAEGELTCCVADFVAMVVADTQFHARQAAANVKIDYEVLEPITDPFDALKPGAPLVHSADVFAPRPSNVLQPVTAFSRGNAGAALATAAHVIEATFQTQPVDIAFLEPEACLAVPQGNGVRVHTQSQGSVYDHAQIAKILDLDPRHVEIVLAASGGAFGAKEELSIQGQTAVAAHLLQRPVKTVLTRQQSTQHHVKRHAMTIALTVGADAEGRLLALRSRIVADAGGYHTTSAKCALRAACHSCGAYRVPNVDVEAKAVYTNNPNAGAMRGFGSN